MAVTRLNKSRARLANVIALQQQAFELARNRECGATIRSDPDQPVCNIQSLAPDMVDHRVAGGGA